MPVGGRDGFRFVRGRKPTLGRGGVLLCGHAVLVLLLNGAETLSFEASGARAGIAGPSVSCWTRTRWRIAFLILTEVSLKGAYRWSETAGLKQLIRDSATISQRGSAELSLKR